MIFFCSVYTQDTFGTVSTNVPLTIFLQKAKAILIDFEGTMKI